MNGLLRLGQFQFISCATPHGVGLHPCTLGWFTSAPSAGAPSDCINQHDKKKESCGQWGVMKYNKGRKPCSESHKHISVAEMYIPAWSCSSSTAHIPTWPMTPPSHPDGQSLWQPLSPKLLLPQWTAAHEACDWSETRRRHSMCQNTSKKNFAFHCRDWPGLVKTVHPILNYYHLESCWLVMCFSISLSFNNWTRKVLQRELGGRTQMQTTQKRFCLRKSNYTKGVH